MSDSDFDPEEASSGMEQGSEEAADDLAELDAFPRQEAKAASIFAAVAVVPAAASAVPVAQRSWPIVTALANRKVVSRKLADGSFAGRPGRAFLASRSGGARYHVGIDLFANEGDEVVALEDGRIVAYYPFYNSAAGEMTWALLVEHSQFVANYGEVKAGAGGQYGWAIGDQVAGGQTLARVSSTNMIHFETYATGTTRSHRWMVGTQPPAELRNPTALLVETAAGTP